MKKKIIYFSLILAFIITWIWAAVEPLHYADWVLENVLVFLFMLLILLTGRMFEFSILSYVFMTIFMILHVTLTLKYLGDLHWVNG